MNASALLSQKSFQWLALWLGFATTGIVEAASTPSYYRPGDVLTNFTLYARLPWTNVSGQVFPSNSPIRLSDFAGHVVFFEFFDPT